MITKELKKQLKTELEDKLETDRLERVKENGHNVNYQEILYLV